MRARRQIGDDRDRLGRAASGDVIAEPQHASGLGDPTGVVSDGEAVRKPQSLGDGHRRTKPLRPRGRRQRDDTSLARNRHQQRPGRIEREHARRAEAVRDELDAKARGQRDWRRLCRRGCGGAERAEHRDDEAHSPHAQARRSVWTKFTLAYLWDAIPYPTVSPFFLAFPPKRIPEFAQRREPHRLVRGLSLRSTAGAGRTPGIRDTFWIPSSPRRSFQAGIPLSTRPTVIVAYAVSRIRDP